MFIAAILCATPALAQQPPPSPERTLAACQALRTVALNQHDSVVAVLQVEIERLTAEIEKLKHPVPPPRK